MNPYRDKDLRSFIDRIPPEEIEKHTQEMFDKNDKMYKEMIEKLNNGECFLCGKRIEEYDRNDFCLHWFTYPDKIKKKYFERHLNNQEFSFTRIDSYFRWLAHSEDQFKNISDLRAEMSQNAYLESTIKFRNIEWSISIGDTDLEGHESSFVGNRPHYHIQMLVDNMPFIRFNDLHILFTDEDLFNIEFLKQNKDRVKWVHSYGQGISILENNENLELLDECLTASSDEGSATFHTETLIMAPEGQTLSGDLLAEAIKLSKERNKPISQIMKELAPDANITKIIFPGDGVPEIAKRSGKK